MRRTRLWIGLPVIEVMEGVQLGEVVDVLFDQDPMSVSLLVKKEGALAGQATVHLADIKSIGEDAITLDSSGLLKDYEKTGDELCLFNGNQSLAGKELLTEGGTVLGTVADVYIGEETDNIIGYEVSDGLIADLVAGRKWMPFSDTLQIGDQIIVKATAKLSDLQPNT